MPDTPKFARDPIRFRPDPELLAQLEAYRERLRREIGGEVGMSAVVRDLLRVALGASGADAGYVAGRFEGFAHGLHEARERISAALAESQP